LLQASFRDRNCGQLATLLQPYTLVSIDQGTGAREPVPKSILQQWVNINQQSSLEDIMFATIISIVVTFALRAGEVECAEFGHLNIQKGTSVITFTFKKGRKQNRRKEQELSVRSLLVCSLFTKFYDMVYKQYGSSTDQQPLLQKPVTRGDQKKIQWVSFRRQTLNRMVDKRILTVINLGEEDAQKHYNLTPPELKAVFGNKIGLHSFRKSSAILYLSAAGHEVMCEAGGWNASSGCSATYARQGYRNTLCTQDFTSVLSQNTQPPTQTPTQPLGHHG